MKYVNKTILACTTTITYFRQVFNLKLCVQNRKLHLYLFFVCLQTSMYFNNTRKVHFDRCNVFISNLTSAKLKNIMSQFSRAKIFKPSSKSHTNVTSLQTAQKGNGSYYHYSNKNGLDNVYIHRKIPSDMLMNG